MQVPRFMRRVNRVFTNRVMEPVARLVPPLAVVHHRGRKSGARYRTPVLAFPVAGGVLTPLPYGTDTDWVSNLLAAGGGTLEVSGRQVAVANPRVVDTEEALELVPALLQPAIRLLGLPGFLLLDRVVSPRRSPSRRPTHRR